jgi:hypothetical protein
MKLRINIPESLDDVTLGTFIKYQTARTDMDRICAYTGVKKDIVENWTYGAVNKALELIGQSVNNCTPIHLAKFRIEGKLYGFVPDMDLLTMREHVDAEAWATEIWKPEGMNWTRMPELMAVLFRPITAQLGDYYDIEKYSMESAKQYVDKMKQMRMSQVQGALVFFSTTARESIVATLEQELTEELMKMKTK